MNNSDAKKIISDTWSKDEMELAWNSLSDWFNSRKSVEKNPKLSIILTDHSYQSALTELKITDKIF